MDEALDEALDELRDPGSDLEALVAASYVAAHVDETSRQTLETMRRELTVRDGWAVAVALYIAGSHESLEAWCRSAESDLIPVAGISAFRTIDRAALFPCEETQRLLIDACTYADGKRKRHIIEAIRPWRKHDARPVLRTLADDYADSQVRELAESELVARRQ